MDSLYSVIVRLGMDSAGFAAGASLATTLLQKIEAQAATAGTSVAALHRSIGLLGAGVAITGVGFLLGDALLHAARKGAELQVVMAGIGLATGATHAQMAALESSFTTIGLKNQMSKTDAAHIALAATHAGITDTRQLQATIPTLANFAEVQNLSTGASRETAATTGAEYAHLFGAYSSQLLVPLVNDLSKALTHTPLSAAGFLRLTSQFAGQTASVYGTTTPEQLRMQRDDTMMGVLLGQMGQGSRGGTQFGSSITRMATAKEGGAIDRAIDFLEKAGKGQFFDAGGRFLGDRNMLAILQRDRAALPLNVLAAANKEAFGAVGMKLMGNLELPARLQQWDTNATTFARIPGIDQQQQVYNATAAGQSQQWHKNIETAVTLFGTALLPTLIKVSQALVGITRTVVELMQTHPQIVQFAATFAMVAAGAALIAGPVLIAAGAFGILSAAGIVADGAFLPFTAVVLGIVSAVAGVTMAIQHWGDIMRWARDHMVMLHNAVFALSVLVPPLGLAIGAGVLIFQHWGDITRTVGDALGALGTVIAPYVALLTPIVQLAGQLIGAFGQWISTTDLLKASMSQLTAPFVALGGMIHEVQVGLGNLVGAYNKLPAPLRAVIATGAQGAALSLLHNIPLVGGLFGQGGGGGGAAPGGTPARSMTTYQTTNAAMAIHQATHATHHSAVVHNHHAAAAIQQATHAAHPAVVQNHHTTTAAAHHTMTPTPTARGGDTHIHVHPGAAPIHVHPSPTHDHRKIADEVAKAAGDHLGHHIANALRTSGVLPSTTRPTLHQLG
jgi:hypothetical protein